VLNNLRRADPGPRRVRFEWTPPEEDDIDFYIFRLETFDPCNIFSERVQVVNVSDSEVMFTDLEENSLYDLYVAGVNCAGIGGFQYQTFFITQSDGEESLNQLFIKIITLL